MLAVVQNVGGRPEQALFREFRGTGVADTGMGRAVGERRILVVEFLQVVRQDDAGDRTLVVRDAHGAVDQMADLLRHARHPDIFGDILKQVLQIDFLLVAGAEAAPRLLANQRDDGHMIHLGIVKPVQKMDRAWPGSRVAQADLAGELGMRRRHEGRHLFVTDLNVLHLLLGFFQRDVESADAVSGISVNASSIPIRTIDAKRIR